MTEWLLKTFTTYRGNFYRPGEVMELIDKEVNSYPLKALVERGHLVRMEASESLELRPRVLEEVNGIGPTYAEEIVDRYRTIEKLVEAGASELSEEISGVDLEKAEEIIELVTS